jgi:hypothetical protein
MRCTSLGRLLGCAALLAAFGLGATAADDNKDKDGFTPLFNGKDFTGWKFAVQGGKDPDKTWSVREGVIVCTGRPNGFFYTDKSYKDYVLRYDWRYKRPGNLTDDAKFGGNSGCLVHIHDPGTPAVGGVWPQCVEVQGMNRDHGKLLFLKTKGKGQWDKEAKDKATRPVGEWNTTEIVCQGDGSITCKINGTPVSSGKSDLTEGMIGFQSEGAEIHFRAIKIKERK